MVTRRAMSPAAHARVRQVILDTADARFPAEVTKLAQSLVAQGDPVYGASCIGVGQGSMKWSEEDLKALSKDRWPCLDSLAFSGSAAGQVRPRIRA